MRSKRCMRCRTGCGVRGGDVGRLSERTRCSTMWMRPTSHLCWTSTARLPVRIVIGLNSTAHVTSLYDTASCSRYETSSATSACYHQRPPTLHQASSTEGGHSPSPPCCLLFSTQGRSTIIQHRHPPQAWCVLAQLAHLSVPRAVYPDTNARPQDPAHFWELCS
jgi:hypothetical protein